MRYVIMAGGNYNKWETPRHLTKLNGERIIDRTIRLLKENGIEKVYISSNNPMFDTCDAIRLEHSNNYSNNNGQESGYWLDAYYPFPNNEQVCYLYGDVYYSENAIKTIVEYESTENTLFGNSVAMNKQHKNWGEPFAFKVYKNKEFKDGIEKAKRMYDAGQTKRMPITWELYRVLHGLDINTQMITTDYVAIDDETLDIDYPEEIEEMRQKLGEYDV